MLIGGLHKLTLIDFPDKVAAVVFTYGCNFDCSFCHNVLMKKGVMKQDENFLSQISEEEFFSFLKERIGLLDGVCISGGEPTLHEDLPEFIKKIKELGFAVKLDTNGTNPQMLKELISQNLIDYIAMDIKAPLNERAYERATNKKIDQLLPRVKESIEILLRGEVDYEFRTTTDKKVLNPKEILEIIKSIHSAKRYYLQNVVRREELSAEVEPYQPEELKTLAQVINQMAIPCEVRNI
ncbi:MAG: anaerobic ribonucleoside-triphosphate reductase activating protein [bacterium]